MPFFRFLHPAGALPPAYILLCRKIDKMPVRFLSSKFSVIFEMVEE
jgi:hypothetical protein